MREDFHQVLIERPRYGMRSKLRNPPRPRVVDWDGEEFADSPPVRPSKTKSFSDHLVPLKRWLKRQCNRPWDKVYSELVGGVDRRSVVGQHLLDHALQEIELHCFRDQQGRLMGRGRYGHAGPVSGLFVDPDSRLLRWAARQTRAQRLALRQRHYAARFANLRRVDADCYLQQIRGLWFALQVRRLDFREECQGLALIEAPEGRCVVLGKRQLGAAELREHGLQNMPAD